MPSLKELRGRITSVKSTRKITSAMKMVAASKLRRAQDAAEASRPYAERMEGMLGNLAASVQGKAGAPPLLGGTGKDDVHMVLLMTANRGLCGGFNTNLIREARAIKRELEGAGKTVKFMCIGRKGRDAMRNDSKDQIVWETEDLGRTVVPFATAEEAASELTRMFEAGEFDVCTQIYAAFQSAMTQIVTRQQLVPFQVPEVEGGESDEVAAPYDYEPSEEAILEELLPKNLAMQIFKALLENGASEQGARMTAMDNATRNAGDMIDDLTLTYNRTRQAFITKELIEIISGAEAV